MFVDRLCRSKITSRLVIRPTAFTVFRMLANQLNACFYLLSFNCGENWHDPVKCKVCVHVDSITAHEMSSKAKECTFGISCLSFYLPSSPLVVEEVD